MARKADKEPDKLRDKKPASRRPSKARNASAFEDRGEAITAMEPMTISESSKHRAALSDKVLQLTQRAAAIRERPH